MKVTGKTPGSSCSIWMTYRRNSCAPKPSCFRLSALPISKQILLCALAMALSAVPFYAQKGGGTRGSTGRTGGIFYPPVYNRPGIDPTMQPNPNIPPLPKPTIADDQKCFPWKLSEARSTTVSVTRLQVPSKARGEFEKACEALHKNKLEEAGQHARKAIDKFPSYSAAWVMSGVILEAQHKPQAAGDACSHAVTIDAKYLPAYLCMAEIAVRNQEWKQVLDLANMSQGLNSQGDAYVHYYRATAYLQMNNLVEAKKAAFQALDVDVNHSDPVIYFLLAQIYERAGDNANAIAQLRLLLKHHADPQQEEKAKQYLATLESQQSAK